MFSWGYTPWLWNVHFITKSRINWFFHFRFFSVYSYWRQIIRCLFDCELDFFSLYLPVFTVCVRRMFVLACLCACLSVYACLSVCPSVCLSVPHLVSWCSLLWLLNVGWVKNSEVLSKLVRSIPPSFGFNCCHRFVWRDKKTVKRIVTLLSWKYVGDVIISKCLLSDYIIKSN